MNLIYPYTITVDNSAKYELLIILAVSAIIGILVFSAIMTIFTISNTLKIHTAILKEQQQELNYLNRTLKELLKINATNVNNACTTGKDTSDND